MPNEYIRKEFLGGAPSTTVSGALSDVATTITVASGTGLPTGAGGRFVMVIDRGLLSEEKVLVTTRSGTSLQNVQRGYDGTAAVSHLSGAVIEHCIDAHTIDQANALANAMTAQYDLVMRGAAANTFTRIPVGADNNVLSVQGGVPTWTTPGTATISDGSVTLVKLATAVQNLLVPAGTLAPYVGATAPTGWLLHNQAVASAQSLYPALWAVAPASWKSGSTLNIPDLSDAVFAQTGGSAAALGATGGAMSVTLVTGNLPSHTHPIDHDHGSVTSGNETVGHTHLVSGTTSSDGSHVHGYTGVGPNQNGVLLTASATSSFALGNGGSLQAYATYANAMDAAGSHSHTWSGTSTGASTAHQHAVDLPNFTGTSGAAGSGMAVTTRPRHLGVNFILKAH